VASEKRIQRVAEQIRKELGAILLHGRDGAFSGVTVTEVRLTRDLSLARVFVSVMDESPAREDRLKALHHANKDIRRELAHKLRIRAVPQIRFLLDESLDHAESIERLLGEIRAERGEEPGIDDGPGPESRLD